MPRDFKGRRTAPCSRGSGRVRTRGTVIDPDPNRGPEGALGPGTQGVPASDTGGGGPADPYQGLTLGRLARSMSGLSGASLLGSALAIPTTLLVARWLGPRDYGHLQVVTLFYFYAFLFRTGLFEAGVRDFVHHNARGSHRDALHAQNVAVTTDFLVSLIPGFVLFGLAFTLENSTERLGLLLAPATVLVSNVSSYYIGLYTAREQFGLVGRLAALRAVLYAPLVLLGVHFFGAVGAFLAPSAVDALITLGYATRRPRLSLSATFDRRASWSLLRAGLPLGLGTVVYWLYRMIGTTTVAVAHSAASVGLYAFAAAPVLVATRALASVHTVLVPAVWRELAVGAPTRRWVHEAERTTIAVSAVAGLVANLAQAAFGPAVVAVAPAYLPAVPVFNILAFNILLLLVTGLPTSVLESKTVNRQHVVLGIFVAAVILNVAANALAVATNQGLLAIAFNDVWVQLVVVTVVFHLSRTHLGPAWRSRRMYSVLAAILLVTAVTGFVLDRLPLPLPGLAPVLASLTSRTLGVVAVWSVVAAVLWRAKLLVPPQP